MPNWCHNRVTFSGTTEEINNIIKFVSGDTLQEPFSLNAIIPMPEEIRGNCSPVKAFKSKVEVEAYNTQLPTGFNIGKAITHSKRRTLCKKYGSDNWYDWANEHWGTKWDVEDSDITDDHEDGIVTYSFETAWGPPEPIFNMLSGKYPDVHISWFYDEPGMEFSGYLPH